MNEEQRWVLNYTLRPIDCCLISVSINIFTPKNKLLAMRIFWSFLLCFGWLLYSRSLLELWFFFFLQKLICLFTKTALIKMILNIFIFLAVYFSMVLQIIAIVVCFSYFTYIGIISNLVTCKINMFPWRFLYQISMRGELCTYDTKIVFFWKYQFSNRFYLSLDM